MIDKVISQAISVLASTLSSCICHFRLLDGTTKRRISVFQPLPVLPAAPKHGGNEVTEAQRLRFLVVFDAILQTIFEQLCVTMTREALCLSAAGTRCLNAVGTR